MRKKTARTGDDAGEMSLSGHLRELRNRLLVWLGALAAAMVAGLCYAPRLLGFLLRLGEKYRYRFVYLSPEELLLEYMAVALAAALCLTFPLLLYELWAFLRPGLKPGERTLALAAICSGTAFAILGVLFAGKLLVPFMLRFLISLCEGGTVQPSISVRNYVSFLLTVFLVFACVFELPVAAVLLTQFHLLTVETLKRFRKAALPLVFLLAAVITPPDVVSQLLVAVPLLLLYEISIVFSTWAEKIRGRFQNTRGRDGL